MGLFKKFSVKRDEFGTHITNLNTGYITHVSKDYAKRRRAASKEFKHGGGTLGSISKKFNVGIFDI